MKVAVTGGTGFIGQRIVRILRSRGHEVVCAVRSPDKATALSAMGAELKRGDILDRKSLDAAFAGCEGVMHIAASYEIGVVGKAADEALAKNLEGTRIALEAARDSGAKKIVYTSSIVVYGNTNGQVVAEGGEAPKLEFPGTFPTFYAYSKARAHYDVAVPLMKAGAPIVIVQPGAVFGPRDHSTLRVLWAALARGLPVPAGAAQYGIVEVEDCAMGHVLALEKGRVGECYHLVAENLALNALYGRAAKASGLPARDFALPDWMLSLNEVFVKIFERIVPLPDVMSSDSLRALKKSLTLTVDHKKAAAELGWTTGDMSAQLRDVMIDELKRRGRKLPAQLAASAP